MFLSVVILGRFTTETHAMALYIGTDTPHTHLHHVTGRNHAVHSFLDGVVPARLTRLEQSLSSRAPAGAAAAAPGPVDLQR